MLLLMKGDSSNGKCGSKNNGKKADPCGMTNKGQQWKMREALFRKASLI
jgi:hypothetical protein